MYVIAVVNQKGGCGKTTTAINLSGVLAKRGHRTLLVDMDPQSHCAAGLAIPEQRIEVQIGDALAGAFGKAVDTSRLVWQAGRNLDLAPSTVKLAALESARGELSNQDGAERALERVLEPMRSAYEFCVIDCSPSIGLLTFNALCAADEVLIPVETGFFSLQGTNKQISTVRALGKRLGVAPGYRLLATLHDGESALACDLLDQMRTRFEDRVIPVVIRYDTRLKEAVSFGQPVIEYAPDSKGAQDYSELGRWMLETIGTGRGRRGENGRRRAGSGEPARADCEREEGVAAGVNVSGVRAMSERAADVLSRAMRGHVSGGNGSAVSAPVAALPGAPGGARPGGVLELVDAPSVIEGKPNPAVAGLLGVRVTRQGVVFMQPAGMGEKVCIAGNFNGWSATATPMRLNPEVGVFEACVPIPTGVIEYRLVIDGRWIVDPFNPLSRPNPFGEANSIVEVPAHGIMGAA